MDRNAMRAEYRQLDEVRRTSVGGVKAAAIKRMKTIETELGKGQFIEKTMRDADVPTFGASSLASGCVWRGHTTSGICISEGGYWRRGGC